MKHVVAGTAGHIDHGKTALVRALTGIDTDRLAEEKRRGITIDLGFAHMQLTPELRLAFVDVPGHERFVKNMLAGAGGIDLALLVVAAGESVMPQTREHFEICRLLGVRRGVVALTKADLADDGVTAAARAEVESLTAGSFLEGAPIVAVSSATGAGLGELRRELARAAEAAPARDAAGWFRLPIDRVFTVKGAGVVATGTLLSGAVAKGREVEVYPGARRLRVRGVEVHGEAAERASAGQRTALNLADIEVADLRRGFVLSEPGRFRPAAQLDCRLELLRGARPLKHRSRVHFHAGTAEIQAEVRLAGREENGRDAVEPGAAAWVRMALREPALLLPGDRFIVRSFSPVTTIGGGVVLDIDSGARLNAGFGARLEELWAGGDPARVAMLAREAAHGVGMADLVARTGLTEAAVEKAAAHAGLALLDGARRWYAERGWLEETQRTLARTVGEFHRANPLAPGMAKEELRARALPDAPAFVLDALLAAAGGDIPLVEGGLVRLPGHKVSLRDDEARARAAIEQAFARAGLAAPPLAEALANSGVEAARARALLAMLLREKALVKIGEDLVLHRTAVEALRAALARRRPARFTVGEFKSWTGVSRKYAIPLLEYLDRERVTRREGDARILL
ncbi:MAG TPA: selenocysteine-specific translation elongation factor [Bryobacteraceae bacterium]|nr:selenocysteine-specific translation elongation factor [Bryobacteraceae bacterium]